MRHYDRWIEIRKHRCSYRGDDLGCPSHLLGFWWSHSIHTAFPSYSNRTADFRVTFAWPVQLITGFSKRRSSVGFMVHKVAEGQDFLRVLPSILSVIIPPMLSNLFIITRQVNCRLVPRMTEFDPGELLEGFVVYKVSLTQVFLHLLRR